MYKTGQCAQIAKEMSNYSIDILGIIEARWNQSGKITLSTGEEILHSCNENEKDHHTKGRKQRAASWNGNLSMKEQVGVTYS